MSSGFVVLVALASLATQCEEDEVRTWGSSLNETVAGTHGNTQKKKKPSRLLQ
jgi:hypothetical protein